jgi:PPK2 family polyphosphate:nucleotide phosphotransferase
MSKIAKFIAPYRVDRGKGFRLKSIDPSSSGHLTSESKDDAQTLLRDGVERLCELQDRLYAQDRWALLLVFQAMDGAGKDSAIKHVMSGVNPVGCQVVSFKAPTAEELDHDYLWRALRVLPERGRIGIFNRSYYEDVLIAKVVPGIVERSKIPGTLITKRLWDERYEDIRAVERYLTRNGTIIRKFFLHVSKDEQRKRFLERLDKPEKNWKFNLDDLETRDHWGDYMDAYEDAIRATATEDAPWFVVPADRKWFTRLVVAAAVIDALESLDLEYPKVGAEQQKDIATGRVRLAERQKNDKKNKKR